MTSTKIIPKEKAKNNISYYVCPSCKEIPELSMRSDTSIDIFCRCQRKKDSSIQNIQLQYFIDKIIDKNFNPNLVKEESNMDHSNQGEMFALCEDKNCISGGNREFYCKNCRYYLCFRCKTTHE